MNYTCYMLWDISPLSYWERSAERGLFYEAVAEVMEHALQSSNQACVESGLHGLGIIHSSYAERVEEVIERFLNAPKVAGESRQYAANARRGYVQ